MLEEPVCGAAVSRVAAACSDHEQVGVFVTGDPQQRIRWLPAFQPSAVFDSEPAQWRGPRALQLLFVPPNDGIGVDLYCRQLPDADAGDGTYSHHTAMLTVRD